MSGCLNKKQPIIHKHISKSIIKQTKKHPCYSENAHDYARMHVAVAPKCNVSCNYCNRKYDCQNESRPGVTSKVLTPEEALNYYKNAKKVVDKLSVVGIAGPGDALANFEETLQTIKLIKEYDKNVIFCLSTNGLALPDYLDKIIELDVHHVTITINAIDPIIASKIYKHVFYRGQKYTGITAGQIIIKNQLEGLKKLASQNVMCKVNIVYIEGINDKHIEEVVKTVANYGACMTNIIPMIPVENTVFSDLEKVSQHKLLKMRKSCEQYVTQMYHCKQCRADAVGKLGADCKLKTQIS